MHKTINSFFGYHRFLSNFYPTKILFEKEQYPSVEHAYQAAKTLIPEERNEIKNADTPNKAKRFGQSVTLRSDWEIIKIQIMTILVRQKFKNLILRKKLLRTSPSKLIEANSWNDTFWGVCKGIGQNHLGKILMQVRKEIIKKEYDV